MCHNDQKLYEVNVTQFDKREVFPVTSYYTAYQIAQKGTWWSAWSQASGCSYCQDDPGSSFTLEIDYSNSIEWGGEIGFSIIESLLETNFAWSVTETLGWSSQADCECSGTEPVRGYRLSMSGQTRNTKPAAQEKDVHHVEHGLRTNTTTCTLQILIQDISSLAAALALAAAARSMIFRNARQYHPRISIDKNIF